MVDLLQQLRHWHAERLREARQCADGGVVSSSFKFVNVLAGDGGLFRQRILTQATMLSEVFDPLSHLVWCRAHSELYLTLRQGHRGGRTCLGILNRHLDGGPYFRILARAELSLASIAESPFSISPAM